jgi:hypothetical protein
MTGLVAEHPVAVALPVDLAPSLTERVLRLLAEVPTTAAPELAVEVVDHAVHRCVVCHQGGKLGGHHGADGRVQWIHRKCHRRLHRSGRHDVVTPAGQSRRYAC